MRVNNLSSKAVQCAIECIKIKYINNRRAIYLLVNGNTRPVDGFDWIILPELLHECVVKCVGVRCVGVITERNPDRPRRPSVDKIDMVTANVSSKIIDGVNFKCTLREIFYKLYIVRRYNCIHYYICICAYNIYVYNTQPLFFLPDPAQNA